MTAWNRDVYSKMVNNIGYDPETKELFVTWRNGKRSIYSDVPEDLAETLVHAPSVGTMMNEEVKPYFPHRYG